MDQITFICEQAWQLSAAQLPIQQFLVDIFQISKKKKLLKVDTFLAQRRMLNYDESESERVLSLTHTHRKEQSWDLTRREREKLLFLAFTRMAAHLKHLTGTLRECLCKNSAQQKRQKALRLMFN